MKKLLLTLSVVCCLSAKSAIVSFTVHNGGGASGGEFGQSLPGVYAMRGFLDFTIAANATVTFTADDGGPSWPSFGDPPGPQNHPLTLGLYVTDVGLSSWTAPGYIIGQGGHYDVYINGANAPVYKRVNFFAQNNSTVPMTYIAGNSGSASSVTAWGPQSVVVPPGTTYSGTLDVSSSDAPNWNLYQLYSPSGNNNDAAITAVIPPSSIVNSPVGVTGPSSDGVPAGGVSSGASTFHLSNTANNNASGGGVYDASTSQGAKIIWSSDAYSSIPAAIQNMGNAIYSANQQMANSVSTMVNQNHADMITANSLLGQILTSDQLGTLSLNGTLQQVDGVLIQIKSDTGSMAANAGLISGKMDTLVTALNGAGFTTAVSDLKSDIATHDATLQGTFSNSLASFSSSLTNADVLGNLSAISNFLSDVGATNDDMATESTLKGISNLLSGIAANGVTSSGTNVLSLTNVAQENTLAGISNLLAGATNGSPTDQQARGQVAASDGVSALHRMAGSMSAPEQNEHYGTPLDGWSVSVPYGSGYTIDLNPFHMGWVVSLAAFVRNLVSWIFAVGLVHRNATLLITAIQSLGSTRQASASGQAILGVNANLATALICAGLITAAMLAVPVYFSDWFNANNLFSVITNNPFHNVSGGTVANSIWMADQFFPLSYMIWCVVTGILFKVNLAPVIWLVQTVTRFLVG